MANCSQKQNTTLSPKLISLSDCFAWLTVYGIEAVAIITLNVLTAVIYLKKRSLRKSGMYLVITLAVADIFTGGLLIFDDWFLGCDCNFWTSDLNRSSNFVITALFRFFPLASVTNLAAIALGGDTRNLSSIRTSSRQKENLWSSSCGCLGNSWTLFNHQFH